MNLTILALLVIAPIVTLEFLLHRRLTPGWFVATVALNVSVLLVALGLCWEQLFR